jgi:Protein kinase domain
LDANDNIKIADFGMARLMKDDYLSTSCGSPHYAAPEVVRGDLYDGRGADVWSCGVILFALFTGKLPFDDADIRLLLYKVKAGAFTMPKYLHRNVKDLIANMLVVDPRNRYTIRQIREHPLFVSHRLTRSTPFRSIVEQCQDVALVSCASELDVEIIDTLVSLGCGSPRRVTESLLSATRNVDIVLYRLLEQRKCAALAADAAAASSSSSSSPSSKIPESNAAASSTTALSGSSSASASVARPVAHRDGSMSSRTAPLGRWNTTSSMPDVMESPLSSSTPTSSPVAVIAQPSRKRVPPPSPLRSHGRARSKTDLASDDQVRVVDSDADSSDDGGSMRGPLSSSARRHNSHAASSSSHRSALPHKSSRSRRHGAGGRAIRSHGSGAVGGANHRHGSPIDALISPQRRPSPVALMAAHNRPATLFTSSSSGQTTTTTSGKVAAAAAAKRRKKSSRRKRRDSASPSPMHSPSGSRVPGKSKSVAEVPSIVSMAASIVAAERALADRTPARSASASNMPRRRPANGVDDGGASSPRAANAHSRKATELRAAAARPGGQLSRPTSRTPSPLSEECLSSSSSLDGDTSRSTPNVPPLRNIPSPPSSPSRRRSLSLSSPRLRIRLPSMSPMRFSGSPPSLGMTPRRSWLPSFFAHSSRSGADQPTSSSSSSLFIDVGGGNGAADGAALASLPSSSSSSSPPSSPSAAAAFGLDSAFSLRTDAIDVDELLLRMRSSIARLDGFRLRKKSKGARFDVKYSPSNAKHSVRFYVIVKSLNPHPAATSDSSGSDDVDIFGRVERHPSSQPTAGLGKSIDDDFDDFDGDVDDSDSDDENAPQFDHDSDNEEEEDGQAADKGNDDNVVEPLVPQQQQDADDVVEGVWCSIDSSKRLSPTSDATAKSKAALHSWFVRFDRMSGDQAHFQQACELLRFDIKSNVQV